MPGLHRIVIALALVAVTACSRSDPVPGPSSDSDPAGSPASQRQPTYAFVQVGAESAWRTAETASIRGEAEKRGVKLLFADGQQRQATQMAALRSFIGQRVDAIILAPVVASGWEPVLREAKAAKVPIVLVDRGIDVGDDSLYATLIASDFVEEGRMAARWLAERTKGECRIVELEGTTGSAPAIDRKKGFAEVIAQHPGMTIIKSQPADFERGKGKEVMEAFIKADGPQIQAVYAHNDDMALGAIQALKEAGMKPGIDVLVVSIDAVKPAFDAMILGELNATVECNPLLGPMAFDAIECLRRGETLPKFIKQEDRLFVAEQAAGLIAERQY